MDPVILIVAGLTAAVGLGAFTFGGALLGPARRLIASFEAKAEGTNVSTNVTKLVSIAAGIALGVALLVILIFQPPALVDVAVVALCAAGAYLGTGAFLKFRFQGRQKAFLGQLEMALRMMSSSLRVGLGLRQAIVIVTEELADPARHEFLRVIGRTNIGIGILDAIDEVSERMPSPEMTLSARAIRVQSKTGGDLAKVLEGAADTIRARRGLVAKMRSLTAEGRASGMIILALPLVIGAFIMLTQPAMGHALLFTKIGLSSLGLVAVLEIAAGLSLNKIMAFDV
jgi:tight adherence protein B